MSGTTDRSVRTRRKLSFPEWAEENRPLILLVMVLGVTISCFFLAGYTVNDILEVVAYLVANIVHTVLYLIVALLIGAGIYRAGALGTTLFLAALAILYYVL